MNDGSKVNKQSGFSNERTVPAEQGVRGLKCNEGSQLNTESGV